MHAVALAQQEAAIELEMEALFNMPDIDWGAAKLPRLTVPAMTPAGRWIDSVFGPLSGGYIPQVCTEGLDGDSYMLLHPASMRVSSAQAARALTGTVRVRLGMPVHVRHLLGFMLQ